MPVIPSDKPSIGLCMIVKNESSVIERCLRSVAPFITCWTIVDTGSSDGTQRRIKRVMAELQLPGELHERPWVNFGHNRSESIALARARSDYLLIIDADEVLLAAPGVSLPWLTQDAYSLTMLHGDLRYGRMCLIKSSLDWRYVGVLHEYLDAGREVIPVAITDVSVLYTTDGARSRNPNKYLDDAAVLEQALLVEPENSRYCYYLAQSWRDAGCYDKAIACYVRRTEMGGWAEEDWHARYQIAKLQEVSGSTEAEVINSYLASYEFRPSRVEPLVWLAVYLRKRGRWPTIKVLLKEAMLTSYPNDNLFVEPDCYGWRRLDEYALSLYYTGNKYGACELWHDAVAKGVFPATEIARIHKNIQAC